MPRITEIADKGAPTIKELRESQKRGSEGQRTSEYTFAEKMAQRNQGTGLGEGSDPQFPEAGEYASEGKRPWE